MAGERILVVEDNRLNRKLVHDVLQARGFDVLEAETGEEGLRLARAQQPRLILMDLQLPDMDGLAAARALRADPATRAIPIVAVTASVMQTDRAEVMRAGFDGFQAKPISVDGLLDEVRRLLDGSARQATATEPRPAPATSSARVEAAGDTAHVLVVDDTPQNRKLLADLLGAQGYRITSAESGPEALAAIAADRPDLVLLDVMMPGMSGYEVCRRLRDDPATTLLPVVMVTALDPNEERLKGIEAGADDFLSKPVRQAELLARVRSLLRISRLHKTVARQADELAVWNRTLEERVQVQVTELERLQRLKRFFSPTIAQAIAAEDGALLRPHRRLITVVCVDLRGFTAFAESAEPEEVMQVLQEYHENAGRLVVAFDGTLEQFSGDGIVIFFNDPVEMPDHEERALRMAIALRDAVLRQQEVWRRRGFDLGVGLGIASGYATAGVIGFEEKWEYAVIGSVTNQAARLVAAAQPGQILITERVFTAVEQAIEAAPIGALELKGFRRPVTTYDVVGLRDRAGN